MIYKKFLQDVIENIFYKKTADMNQNVRLSKIKRLCLIRMLSVTYKLNYVTFDASLFFNFPFSVCCLPLFTCFFGNASYLMNHLFSGKDSDDDEEEDEAEEETKRRRKRKRKSGGEDDRDYREVEEHFGPQEELQVLLLLVILGFLDEF